MSMTSNSDGATVSYLLKDKGLEKIDNKKDDKSMLSNGDDKDKKVDGSMMSENKV